MAFSSNFTKITRGTDDDGQEVVFVEGTTDDTGDVLTAMYVNVADRRPVHIARNGTIGLPSPRDLRNVPVENALGAVDWVATLVDGPLPDVDDWVVVVGLAERGGADPAFLWAQTLQVQREGVRAA